MKKTSILLIILLSGFVFSQEKIEDEKFLFERFSTRLTVNDSIEKHQENIKKIHVITKESSENKIEEDSKWELVYLKNSGWRESMPNQRYTINDVYIGKENNSILGADLLNVFNRFRQENIIYLKTFPHQFMIEPRGAALNGKWTIIFLDNDYITLQHIHSYPNGNQSSWFSVTNYYFKKIN
jgi:hypothetical protein